MNYKIQWAFGHWVILKNGQFFGTADTIEEAYRDIEEEDNED